MFAPGPYKTYRTLIQVEGRTDTYDGPVWGTIARVDLSAQEDSEARHWHVRGDAEDTARLMASAPELYEALELFLISEKQLRDAGWKAECDKALAVIKSIQS